MTESSQPVAPAGLPRPFDSARADRVLQQLAECGFVPPADAEQLLRAVFGNSPYLARIALREAEFLDRALHCSPEAVLAQIETSLSSVPPLQDPAEVMSALRVAKRRAALTIAIADISGKWGIDEVTAALTKFADGCVRAALGHLLKTTAADTEFAQCPPEDLQQRIGLIVLAMGKYGARELNYSSDIDLIVFYDAERFPFRKRGDPRAAAVDIVKGLVKLLSEITADGYVFRVDLRLRPDAGATQVAISTQAAEAYYEGLGQNWERAALIKARLCAGDHQVGTAFLKAIEPFIWRRNLDYAAIEDIHSIKRQIHAHAGHGEIAIAGHNIKLGRGGIREIEFFVQTQQLILGGRNPRLRAPGTLATLSALRDRGLVSDEAAAALADAYGFLRRLEHRLQMIEDEQTHTIPKSTVGLAHVSCFMGFDDIEGFSRTLRAHLETVQQHYSRLFEREQPLVSSKGSLVFTGVEDDPETLVTLKDLGFSDVRHVAQAVRGWHHGRIRVTRSARARELLTKLVPPLLEALSATADPDSAFAQFDRFLTRLPAGVQLFSLFLANPHLLKHVADICGAAPRLADHLARSPRVLDALLDPDFLGPLPRLPELESLLDTQLAQQPDYERKLDAVRRYAREQMFRVGAQLIEGTVDSANAGFAFSAIADTAVRGLLPAVENEVAAHSGRVPGGAFAIIAMGKLGGQEMTAASDLDLIFVYDAPAAIEKSDGPQPIPVPLYYARLAQRLISALTAQTSAGGLYDVDMRLRPSGNKGPVAVSLTSFARYHAAEAWTWERMALTRARIISGPGRLARKIETVIQSTLCAGGDPANLQRDAREMREKLAAQFPARDHWDLKFTAGGLVDIEFVAQYLQLRAARPDALSTNTMEALEKLKATAALDTGSAEALLEAAAIQQALTHVLRIAVDGSFDRARASHGLKMLLARAAGERDFDSIERRLMSLQLAARAVYERALCQDITEPSA